MTASHTFTPAAFRSAMTTPTRPAVAATERSSPLAMISGVPAAAISPMKATLVPIASKFLTERKNGERIEKAASSAT